MLVGKGAGRKKGWKKKGCLPAPVYHNSQPAVQQETQLKKTGNQNRKTEMHCGIDEKQFEILKIWIIVDFPFERPVQFIENHFSSSPKGHTGDFKGANMLGLEPKCQFSYLQLQCSVISRIQKKYEKDFQIEKHLFEMHLFIGHSSGWELHYNCHV